MRARVLILAVVVVVGSLLVSGEKASAQVVTVSPRVAVVYRSTYRTRGVVPRIARRRPIVVGRPVIVTPPVVYSRAYTVYSPGYVGRTTVIYPSYSTVIIPGYSYGTTLSARIRY